MSLYNMLHGFEPTAPVVLGIFQMPSEDFPRFRDAYFTYRDDSNEPVMVILTRTGGGNRQEYETENATLRTLPGFIDDIDDDFDQTFALFRYSIPDKYREKVLEYLRVKGKPRSLREKTMQTVQNPNAQQQAVLQQLADQIANATAKESP